MKKFTVLLLYPDYIASNYGEETYLAHVEAENLKGAVKAAQRKVGTPDTMEDYFPLFAAAGFLTDLVGFRGL